MTRSPSLLLFFTAVDIVRPIVVGASDAITAFESRSELKNAVDQYCADAFTDVSTYGWVAADAAVLLLLLLLFTITMKGLSRSSFPSGMNIVAHDLNDREISSVYDDIWLLFICCFLQNTTTNNQHSNKLLVSDHNDHINNILDTSKTGTFPK